MIDAAGDERRQRAQEIAHHVQQRAARVERAARARQHPRGDEIDREPDGRDRPVTVPPATGAGSSSRRTASTPISATTASIAIALTNAASTSARP